MKNIALRLMYDGTAYHGWQGQKTEVTVAADDSSNDSDNDNTDDTTDTSGVNGWLLASSIILAVVLLLAIVSIAVQRIVKKRNRMKAVKPAAKK